MAKPAALTRAQRFYVEQHAGALSVEQMAEDCGVSVELVKGYIPQVGTPYSRSFGRPRPGVLVMTEEASTIGDDVAREAPAAPAAVDERTGGLPTWHKIR